MSSASRAAVVCSLITATSSMTAAHQHITSSRSGAARWTRIRLLCRGAPCSLPPVLLLIAFRLLDESAANVLDGRGVGRCTTAHPSLWLWQHQREMGLVVVHREVQLYRFGWQWHSCT